MAESRAESLARVAHQLRELSWSVEQGNHNLASQAFKRFADEIEAEAAPNRLYVIARELHEALRAGPRSSAIIL